MQELFLQLVQLSLLGSLFALAVMAVRLLFPKAPKWILCLLWGLVAVRLLCPISIESSLSLVPEKISSGQLLSHVGNLYIEDTDIIYENSNQYQEAINAGLTPVDSAQGSYVITAKGSYTPPATLGDTLLPVLSFVWLAGFVAMLLYTLISFYLLRRQMAEATRYRDNIWQCQAVGSPFVLGMLRPKIYLPYDISAEDMENVLAHEQAHIQRKDHWWKPVGFLLLSIHWFNPILWFAYILLCRDIESACDEKVIRSMSKQQKQAYSTALLHCSVHRRRIAACPLAFGETGVKERIVGIMNYKKPAFWLVIAVIVVSIIAGVCFLTTPEAQREPGENDEKLLKMAHHVAQWDHSWIEQPLSILKDNETYQAILGYGSEAVDIYVDHLKKNDDPQYSALYQEGEAQIVMALACAQITGIGADSYGTKWTSGQQWLKLYQSAKQEDYRPGITIRDLRSSWQNAALYCVGQTPSFKAVCNVTYSADNTLEIDGSGNDTLLLSPSADLKLVDYTIYLPDGKVFDDGKRLPYDSNSLYVQQNEDGVILHTPSQSGEYIYEITLYYPEYNITATYGLKVIMTGKTSGYELALQKVVNYFSGQGTDLRIDYETTVCFATGTAHSYYYVFSIKNPADGDCQVAVDVDGKTMYSMEGDTIFFEKILE